MATRDLPKSFRQFFFGWYDHIAEEVTISKAAREAQLAKEEDDDDVPKKVTAKVLWPAFVSGAGLFSDGYVNNSIGTVSTCLSILYEDEYTKSRAISNISSIAFAGTVIGQLSFGYISDHFARKGGMLLANVLLILFTILCAAASWGAHGSVYGMFAALTAFRFFLGIAIGAEYPTSSVIASEFANQLPSGHRNRYFCWFTNSCIDVGFVVSSFVPLVLLWIFSPRHLTAVWRLTLGLGVFPPLALFFMRMKMTDSESFKKYHMKRVKKYPFWLIIKFYWFRLAIVALIWFIYDFSVYSFGTYSSYIIKQVIPDGDLYKSFGWNVVFNLFYIPGTIIGAWVADYLGPRYTTALGVFIQGIIGFAMSARYPVIKHHIAGFVVVFGIFTAFGEFVGNTVGLLAAKSSATPIRGQFYGIAAAIGKVGAFVGTYIFPIIQRHAAKISTDFEMQAPFYVSSSLCIFSAFLALFLLPSVGQDAIDAEDVKFIEYLRVNGFDLSQLGDVTVADEELADESENSIDKKPEVNVETSSKQSN